MMKKIMTLTFVLVLCATSFVFLMADGSVDAETTGTLRPTSDSGGNNKIWYSTNSVLFTSENKDSVDSYLSSHPEGLSYYDSFSTGNFNSRYRYCTVDPSTNVKEFAAGKTDLLETLKITELSVGISYYAISAESGGMGGWTWESAIVSTQMVFFPVGKYTVELTSSNMDGTRSYFYTESFYLRQEYINDGKGTVTLDVASPSSIYLKAYSSKGSNDPMDKFYWKVEYKINPALPEQRTVECTESKTITTNMYWTQRVTYAEFESGTYQCSSGSNSVVFATGSVEEREFIENIINTGSTDISGYIDPTWITLTSKSKISVYTLATVTRSVDSSVYIYKESQGYGEEYGCKLTEYKSETYKFYAGQHFSIAVSYDTSKYSYIILKSDLCVVYLESGKVYDMNVSNATEYEMYGVPIDDSISISPFNVGLYTEGLPTADNNGMIFAGVSIGFCAIAFFLLFFYGRRPKWGDDTGLPSGGTEKVISNEVPDIDDKAEVPEEPSDR